MVQARSQGARGSGPIPVLTCKMTFRNMLWPYVLCSFSCRAFGEWSMLCTPLYLVDPKSKYKAVPFHFSQQGRLGRLCWLQILGCFSRWGLRNSKRGTP